MNLCLHLGSSLVFVKTWPVSFPLFQSFLSRLQIWVNLLDPTSLLASDVSISQWSHTRRWVKNYLMVNSSSCSPQAEIHKAHALLGSGEKLNVKVWSCLRLFSQLFEPATYVFKCFLFPPLGWTCTDPLTCTSCKKRTTANNILSK